MDYEAALISKILEEDVMQQVAAHKITSALVTTYPKEWGYLMRCYRVHGAAPPKDDFLSRFPQFELSSHEQPISFLAEGIRNRFMHGAVVSAMKEATDQLKKGDPAQAIAIYQKMALEVSTKARPSRDVNFAANPMDRLREYDLIAESGGISGLRSPWPMLDEVTLGFQREELWMIVARGGTGKSWAEVIGAHFHWMQGHRPLLITNEMSVQQMIKRLDAAHARVAHTRLRAGRLTYDEYQRYKAVLSAMEGAEPLWISGDDEDEGGSGITNILAKIDKYQPGVVWIDGLYIIEDERKGPSGWERLKNVAGDLQRIPKRKHVPVIVSHQFNQAGKNGDGTENTLAYGDIQKWFDGIIGMYQTDDLRASKEMLFKLLKHREGERFQFVANWDFDSMSFDQKGTGLDDISSAPEDEDLPF